jgi:polyhydroxybutyrate depolymerase
MAGGRLLVAVAVLALGCRSAPPPPPAPAPAAPREGGPPPRADGKPVAAEAPRVLGGARPATVIAPADAQGPLPLVLVLHGYGDTGMSLATHLGYVALARRERVVLVVPDGTPDRRGARFWNATDACCNFERRDVDDVAYLRGLVREAKGAFPIDPARVYVVGLSNGGFMAHRLACEAADDFAAVLSIAGVPWQDAARCRPSSPVSVLQVHGDADRIVPYAGGDDLLGRGGPPYPGAVATAARWATLDRCGGPPRATDRELDLDHAPGTETLVQVAPGCPAGVGVELWQMRGAPHVPHFADVFAKLSFAWLEAHPKKR